MAKADADTLLSELTERGWKHRVSNGVAVCQHPQGGIVNVPLRPKNQSTILTIRGNALRIERRHTASLQTFVEKIQQEDQAVNDSEGIQGYSR